MRLRKRELESEVERVKAVIARLNQAPVEMRRHHSFVFESANILKRAAKSLEKHVVDSDGDLQPLLESMYDVTSDLGDRMRAIAALCNGNESVSPRALRSAANGGLHACKSVLDKVVEIRGMMRVILEDGRRVSRRLSYREKLVRAGAKAILCNLSADDAEDNVRRKFEHLGEFD